MALLKIQNIFAMRPLLKSTPFRLLGSYYRFTAINMWDVVRFLLESEGMFKSLPRLLLTFRLPDSESS